MRGFHRRLYARGGAHSRATEGRSGPTRRRRHCSTGIATGLAQLAVQGRPIQGGAEWLIGIADGPASGPDWTRRARTLAADLLDKRGRLRADVDTGDIDAFALDLCLRRAWPAQFQGVGYPERSAQQELLARMLAAPQPVAGELERSVVWLTAANALVRAAALDLAPDFDRVVEFLERTQGALRRWVWDNKIRSPGPGGSTGPVADRQRTRYSGCHVAVNRGSASISVQNYSCNGSIRARSRSTPARPYMARLSVFNLLI